jgi:hypothetical protein
MATRDDIEHNASVAMLTLASSEPLQRHDAGEPARAVPTADMGSDRLNPQDFMQGDGTCEHAMCWPSRMAIVHRRSPSPKFGSIGWERT